MAQSIKSTGGRVDAGYQDLHPHGDCAAVSTFDSIDGRELIAIKHPDTDICLMVADPQGVQEAEVVMSVEQARSFFEAALKLC